MGTIAQANASILRFAKETNYGVPRTDISYNTARIVSAALAQRTGFTESTQLNTSRQPTETIRNQVSAEGNVGVEFSALAHETFFESLFGGSFANIVSASVTGTMSTASGSQVISATSIFTTTETGDWVRLAGFASASNNGSFYVLSKQNNTTITIAHTTAIANSSAAGVKINANRLAVGSTLVSLALEQKVPTVEPLYELAAGCVMTTMRLDVAPGEIVRGNFDWVGRNVVQSTSTVTTATIAISTTQIANAIDNVVLLREGSMSPQETWRVASFSLNVTSPAEPRFAISDAPNQVPGAISLALRPFGATATMRVYVEHGVSETAGVKDLIASYHAGTARSGLAIIFRDNSVSAAYDTIFHFNSYKITRADIPIGGNDQDLFLEMEVYAIQDPTAGGLSGPWSFMIHRNEVLA